MVASWPWVVVPKTQEIVTESLHLDGGFGTDANINHAVWRGYQLLAKTYSGKPCKKARPIG